MHIGANCFLCKYLQGVRKILSGTKLKDIFWTQKHQGVHSYVGMFSSIILEHTEKTSANIGLGQYFSNALYVYVAFADILVRLRPQVIIYNEGIR